MFELFDEMSNLIAKLLKRLVYSKFLINFSYKMQRQMSLELDNELHYWSYFVTSACEVLSPLLNV